MTGLTGKLRPMMAVVLVTLSLFGCASTSRHETTGQYVDDATLTSKVKTALLEDPNVSGLDVGVETYKGTVQLSGFANTQQEKSRAGEVARSVSGVREVRNNITVKQ